MPTSGGRGRVLSGGLLTGTLHEATGYRHTRWHSRAQEGLRVAHCVRIGRAHGQRCYSGCYTVPA